MPTYREPTVRFVSGHGCRLVDDGGKVYLDFLSGLGVTSLGHADPVVGTAIAAQAARLLHVSNIFGNEFNEDVAAQLDYLVGDGISLGGQVFFANSGAEANECAIKLARRYGGPGRYGIVSAFGSFHGRTLATLHATGQPAKHEAFLPLPAGFSHVPYGDPEALRAIDPTAVVAELLEPILGESGVVPPPPGYLASVRAICDELGLLLIVDEIQTGLGRTGRWFAFQHEAVVPDIVTVAKALGNGVPVGACWARPEVAKAFRPGDHGSTFGGQPFAMAVAQATLGRLRSIDAPGIAARLGPRLARSFAGIDGVASVRGAGFLLGAVLEDGIDSRAVFGEALAAGLVVNAPVPGVVRLMPPFIVTEADCDEAVALLGVAIGRAGASARKSTGERG
jgi:acetylornithine/succinyldiaminopimelate/putrescine aminotransferase